MSDFESMPEVDYNFSDDVTEVSFETATIDKAVEALQQRLPPYQSKEILTGLSSLMVADLKLLEGVWLELDASYRRRLIRDLIGYSEANFDADYRTVGLYALDDSDPAVREAAIELLWEDESLTFLGKLLQLASADSVAEVRAAAAVGLARFIYLGEMQKIPKQNAVAAQKAVIRLLQDPQEPISVQRRALEAIANSSHPILVGSIEDAYRSGNHLMQVSALFAMGRSCDQRWREIILEELDNEDSEIQFEAIRAAGELRIRDSVPKLGQILVDADRETLEMAIWSLGEIGGKESVRILEAMAELAEDEDDLELEEVIEEAIASTVIADMMLDEEDLEG